MTPSPQTLLQELYEIDPDLKAHEAELIPLIAQLLERDPAQKPTAAFVKKLRKELSTRADTMMNGAVEHRMTYTTPSSFFQRFAYAAAGAVAAVVIAVPVTLQYADQNTLVPPMNTGEEMAMKTGDMDSSNQTSPSPTVSTGNPAYGRGQGGGGGDAMGMSLIAPWNPVKYRLEGDLPELPTGDVTVLERRLNRLNVPFSNIQSAFDDAAIDLSTFDNTSVESIALAQRRPFGYYINVSMTDGSVSINQMWDQWPHPENDCRDEACYRNLQPKLSDIPADADLIRIASAFLADHDIDLSEYGTPIVDETWRVNYDAMEDKRYAYVPDSMRVIYPLLVDGQIVVEAGGEPAGISVQVSIRHDRVSDVWGLTTYQFDRSQHDAVSDRATIESFLAVSGSQTPEAPTVTLTNPTLGYVRIFDYVNNVNEELFVPALIFQVENVPTGTYYYQRTVAVPLAKDLLEKATPPMIIDPVPTPRPMDPSASSGQADPLIIEEDMAR